MKRKITLLSLILILINGVSLYQAQELSCEGFTTAELVIGQNGQVSDGSPNNMRDAPSTSGTRIGEIPGGEFFGVLDGPICADNYVWWQVEYKGITGWTVDGANGEFWIFPVAEESTGSASAENDSLINAIPINATNLDAIVNIIEPSCGIDSRYGMGTSALSHSERYVAMDCGLDDGTTGLFDLATLSPVLLFESPGERINQLEFLVGDGYLLGGVLGISDSAVVWDVETGEIVARLGVSDIVAASANGERIITTAGSSARGLIVYDEGDFSEIITLEESRLGIPRGIVISDDAKYAAAAGDNGSVSLWNLETGESWFAYQREETDEYINTQRRAAIFSPSGRFLITSDCIAYDRECTGTSVVWWNVETGEILTEWQNDTQMIEDAAFNSDASLLFMSTYGEVHIFDVQNDRIIGQIGSYDAGGRISLSRDDKMLLTSDKVPIIWGIPETTADQFFNVDPTITSSNSNNESPNPETVTCNGFQPSRLIIGEAGRILDGINLNIRAEASTDGERLGQINAGGAFLVLDGPICTDSGAWWQVQNEDLIGWTIEGSADSYWTETISVSEYESLVSGALTASNIADIEILQEFGRGIANHAIWSDDGNTIALVGSRGLWLYDATDFSAEAQHIQAQIITPKAVDFSPDGSLIAAAICTQVNVDYQCPTVNVIVWNLADGTVRYRYQGQTDEVNSLQFNPAGDIIYFSDGSVVRPWEYAGNGVQNPHFFEASISLVSVANRDGNDVFSAIYGTGYDAAISIYGGTTGNLLDRVVPYERGFFPDPNMDYGVYLGFGLGSGRFTRLNFDLPYSSISFDDDLYDQTQFVHWSADGSHMVVNSGHNLLRWVSSPDLEIIEEYDLSAYGRIEDFSMRPDGSQIVFYDVATANFVVYDLSNNSEITHLDGFNKSIDAITFVGDEIVALDSSSTVLGWNVETGERTKITEYPLSSGLFAQYRRYDDEIVEILHNSSDTEPISIIERFDAGSVTAHSFTADGTEIAIGYENGSIRIYDVNTGEAIRDVTRHDEAIVGLRFANNGLLASTSYDGSYRVWDAETPIFDSVTDSFAAIPAFSPDSTVLLLSSGQYGSNSEVILIDLRNGTEIKTLSSFMDGASDFAFTEDRRLLAISSYDGTVSLWGIPE